MAISKTNNDSTDLPAILSDEEFESLREDREQGVRSELDSADTTDLHRPSDGRPESTIEQRFPHIAKMLVAMWPSEAFALYTSRMVVADRENRAGFPRDVIEDLLMLDEINDMLLGKVGSRQPGAIHTATDHAICKR